MQLTGKISKKVKITKIIEKERKTRQRLAQNSAYIEKFLQDLILKKLIKCCYAHLCGDKDIYELHEKY